jgi:perosamine synthetase
VMNVPLSLPDISQAEIDEVISVLRGSRLSLGPKMEEFEESVSRYVSRPFGIAVSSGTAGLHLCVRALGIGSGDDVIVPSFTFIAAANAIRFEGATPVFVDIERASRNMDPVRIEEAITTRTRAIMVVHTFGVPSDMDEILDIARRHNLRVIEDACEAIGAEYHDRRVGSFGDLGVFAFYPNKQITTGEGGMIVTADAALAREMRALRNQGRYETDAWHQHSLLGFNYRLSEMNCALGCAQLRRIEPILLQRDEVARTYHAALAEVGDIVRPTIEFVGCRISWFVYVIVLEERFSQDQRDAILRLMQQQGIGCGRYFAPVHSQPAYRGLALRHPLPVTLALSARALALPFFNQLTQSDIQFVVSALKAAIQTLDATVR